MPFKKTNKKYNRKFKTKRKGPLTKAQTKAVAKIAKKVDMRVAETKSDLHSSLSTNLFDASVYVRNLVFPMAQGTNSQQYIGEKIYLKNIRIKGQVIFNGSTERDKMWRMLVIRTQTALTNSQAIIGTYTDVWRSTSNNGVLPTVGQPDLHKVQLVYDSGPVRVIKQYISQIPTLPIDLNIQLNKTHYFEQDGGGYLKGGNYYFVFVAQDLSSANMAAIAYDWTINYKDA